MNEFIEKLISRLEENIFVADLYGFGWDGQRVGNLLCLGDVKKLAEQLAEELATDINAGHNNKDLMIVESLPSLYPMMQSFEEEAIYRVVERAKDNNGWILCSERLPDKDMQCWATFESGNVDKIQYFVSQKWWNGEISDNRVVAWMPLPEPYKPKEE